MNYIEKLSRRDQQTIRLLNWIRTYPGWWYLICTPGDEHLNPEIMKLLLGRLEKEQFYELIFVLLMVHRNADFMDGVFQHMLLEMTLANWKGETMGKNQMLGDLRDLLT